MSQYVNTNTLDALYANSVAKQIFQPPPRIHIFITHYNSVSCLERCLESVFSQIVSRPFDVTLVDDCSSESGVVECLEKWRAREKNLTAFRRDTRCSKGLNLFFCLQNTTHKKEAVICILDGDDWFAHSSVLQTVTDDIDRRQSLWHEDLRWYGTKIQDLVG